jgi:hypothetical protein
MVAAPKVVLEWTSTAGADVTHVRSTLIQSSLAGLRDRGLFDAYLEKLDPKVRDAILLNLAPSWMPIALGVEHYRACDALQLSESALQEIGEAAAQRVMGTFLGTLVRSSRVAGTSPWIVCKSYATLWQRLWQGGSIRVLEEGPKDAVLVGMGSPCGQYRYFQVAYCGVVKGALGMFSRSVHVTARPNRAGQLIAAASWV